MKHHIKHQWIHQQTTFRIGERIRGTESTYFFERLYFAENGWFGWNIINHSYALKTLDKQAKKYGLVTS